jgi:cell division protease FtsH
VTAYHEMGHALVGHFLPNADPIHKISIVSRGQALGLTISLPAEDKFLRTRSALLEEMAMVLGGRASEELVFHEITTGAANDLERVTELAKQMVMRLGMSEKLGPRVLGRNDSMPFLGRDLGTQPDYSDEIAREIDQEITRIIEDAHERARAVLVERMDDLHRLSGLLIEHETIDREQFERLLAGEPPDDVFPEKGTEEGPEPEEKAPRRRRTPGAVLGPVPRPLPGTPSTALPTDKTLG